MKNFNFSSSMISCAWEDSIMLKYLSFFISKYFSVDEQEKSKGIFLYQKKQMPFFITNFWWFFTFNRKTLGRKIVKIRKLNTVSAKKIICQNKNNAFTIFQQLFFKIQRKKCSQKIKVSLKSTISGRGEGGRKG